MYHLPKINFNPRAPYGARRSMHQRVKPVTVISIHAPHTGRDPVAIKICDGGPRISIHAPHTGRDILGTVQLSLACVFQSTRPIRGATADQPDLYAKYTFQSTRPRRGATVPQDLKNMSPAIFQSTRPIRGATLVGVFIVAARKISIHAPHTGRDSGRSRPPWPS